MWGHYKRAGAELCAGCAHRTLGPGFLDRGAEARARTIMLARHQEYEAMSGSSCVASPMGVKLIGRFRVTRRDGVALLMRCVGRFGKAGIGVDFMLPVGTFLAHSVRYQEARKRTMGKSPALGRSI